MSSEGLQSAASGSHVLQTAKCTIRFGGLCAVNALDMQVRQGEIYGLIGPNGAGKTTIFNLLTGVYEPTSGEIYFKDQRIDGLRPYEIAARGVSRTFQNIRLCPSMTVLENVMTACHIHVRQSLLDAVLRTPRFARDEEMHVDYCLELLEIFDLVDVKDEGGTSLPYGKQRRLEIVRALATRPQLLLLDEPAAGMNPSEQEDLMGLIKQIRDRFWPNDPAGRAQHESRDGVCERIQVVTMGNYCLGCLSRSRTIQKVIEAIHWETRTVPVAKTFFDLTRSTESILLISFWISADVGKHICKLRRYSKLYRTFYDCRRRRSGTLIGANGAGKTITCVPLPGYFSQPRKRSFTKVKRLKACQRTLVARGI